MRMVKINCLYILLLGFLFTLTTGEMTYTADDAVRMTPERKCSACKAFCKELEKTIKAHAPPATWPDAKRQKELIKTDRADDIVQETIRNVGLDYRFVAAGSKSISGFYEHKDVLLEQNKGDPTLYPVLLKERKVPSISLARYVSELAGEFDELVEEKVKAEASDWAKVFVPLCVESAALCDPSELTKQNQYTVKTQRPDDAPKEEL
eukprot:TRINITY_DN53210_c0_g1_i1.p1 TRINITY_DN53210_c0_g1~~TRINITY_DN53210_c0_g1_i1.p1  ORF type:complete len:207 (+),score=34.69 TRINITY_DN53210_c0_g1_i1:64-684(+)